MHVTAEASSRADGGGHQAALMAMDFRGTPSLQVTEQGEHVK